MVECLLMRWADDSFQSWDGQVSSETKEVLDDLASENFYGGNLQQVPSGKDEDTAFGFKVKSQGGIVTVQAARAFAAERAAEGPGYTRLPHIHGGTQFCSEKIKVATVQGRVLRELDLTNETKSEVLGNVTPVVFESMKANYSREIVTQALKRASKVSWVRLNAVQNKVRHWTADQMEDWCEAWDEEQRLGQQQERIEEASARLRRRAEYKRRRRERRTRERNQP